MPLRRRGRTLVAGVAITTAAVLLSPATTDPAWASGAGSSPNPALAETTSPPSDVTSPVPVYAYFYQWFTPSSWNRAKQDLPLAGKYSSDDPHVLRHQIEQARGAGIDGFLTSWKSTPALNRRLDLLISIARSEHFDVGVVYEALDFNRHPLPISTVKNDMVYLVTTRGSQLKSAYYGRPVIIWTGTDQYSVSDVQSVRAALGDRAYLLAASKSVAGYQRVANYVNGEAYYWSSADPSSPATQTKLTAMSDAVHAHHALWIAPASSGFDGRTLGGTRVIGRDKGQTLTHSLDNAFATSPDAVGIISWNEWSENTYIEPGQTYGNEELLALQSYLRDQGRIVASAQPATDSSNPGSENSGWTGAWAAAVLAGGALLGVIGLEIRRRRTLRSANRLPSPDAPGERHHAPAGHGVGSGDPSPEAWEYSSAVGRTDARRRFLSRGPGGRLGSPDCSELEKESL
jgi:hypothetical protein